jgi:hypothetical protein
MLFLKYSEMSFVNLKTHNSLTTVKIAALSLMCIHDSYHTPVPVFYKG